jgi:1,4-alpha-glucan branching enzyme
MLQKKPLAGRKVEVTFRMPPLDGVVELNLRGDFNGWQTEGEPLHQESDGSWSATLVLDAGKSYRFRYNDNQGRWHNDWDADGYVPNDFGSEDSLLDLTHAAGEPAAKAPKAPAKKAPAKKKAPPQKRAAGKTGKGGSGPKKVTR